MRFLVVATLLVFGSCGGRDGDVRSRKEDPVQRIRTESLEKLSTKRIFFGHQSVGYDILRGIRERMSENPTIRWNILDRKDGMFPESGGMLGHSQIGKNLQPGAKIEDFQRKIDEWGPSRLDMALMKLCYVDVGDDTDVPRLFSEYKTRMKEIRERHPGVRIIHSTVPLIADSPSWKDRILKIFGRGKSHLGENRKKNDYNDLLRSEYAGKEPVFDIAQVESTRPDGTRVTSTIDGKTFFCLNPDYTHDGGHLNETGRKVVSGSLLELLVELAEKD